MKKHNYDNLIKTTEAFVNKYQDDDNFKDMIGWLTGERKDGQAILRFEGDLGVRYRVAVPYLEKLYLVFWFQFCEDGSLYLGVRDKNSEHHQAGTVKSIDGKIQINMNGESLSPKLDENEVKDRFSFHGSGEIHDGQIGHTTYRNPLISIKEQEEVCWVCFKELNQFETIETRKKDDISLLMDVPEKHFLIMHALIAPSSKVQLQGINDGKNNEFLLIDFHGVKEIGDVTLQFVFAPCFAEELPQRSVVVWPTLEKANM
ncbi:MAG: hypothetical protein IJ353_02210 [Lachnospiraceae bacterium]|nr:hypothetical protein [Lachnospiraceae bacterium]